MKESVGQTFSHASESMKVCGGLLSFFLLLCEAGWMVG